MKVAGWLLALGTVVAVVGCALVPFGSPSRPGAVLRVRDLVVD
jgi:hypothetical protein